MSRGVSAFRMFPIRRSARFGIVLATVISVASVSFTPWSRGTPRASASPSPAPVQADADWILSAQLADGAICSYPDHLRVDPYLASYAAVGLARAFSLTGSHPDIDAAWKWLAWYASHEDAVTHMTPDYLVGPGPSFTETIATDSSGQPVYDSSDAYAAMFLYATAATAAAQHNQKALRQLQTGVSGALTAIESTQDTDGLTWAKPSFHAKYLMDQSEAFAGFVAAAQIGQTLGDASLRQRAIGDALRLQAGLETMWMPSLGFYAFAKNGDGSLAASDPDIFYPDSVSQMWPVVYTSAGGQPLPNLVPADRSASLQTEFFARWPEWDQPTSTVPMRQPDGTVAVVTTGYWPLVGWNLVSATAAAAATSIGDAAGTGRAWPFNTGVEGQLIVLSSK